VPAQLSIFVSRLVVSLTTKVIVDSFAEEFNIKYYTTYVL
jgi:hypothetical protein